MKTLEILLAAMLIAPGLTAARCELPSLRNATGWLNASDKPQYQSIDPYHRPLVSPAH